MSKPGGLTPQRLLSELPSSPEALLATLARRDAELREEARALQEDVVARARDARRAASGGAAPPPSATAAAPAPAAASAPEEEAGGARQLRQAADALRDEVAKTRAEARSFAPASPLADPSWNPPAASEAQPPAALMMAGPAEAEAPQAAPAALWSGAEGAQAWIDAWRAKQRNGNGA